MPNLTAFTRSLAALQSDRRTGLLRVTNGVTCAPMRVVMCLREGQLLFATETTSERSLGRRLVQQGQLSAPAYSRVAERMLMTLGRITPLRASSSFSDVSETFHFCECAMELGFLTKESMMLLFIEEAKQSAMRAIRCGDVEWAFEDASEAVSTVATMLARSGITQPVVNLTALLAAAPRPTPKPSPSPYATLRMPTLVSPPTSKTRVSGVYTKDVVVLTPPANPTKSPPPPPNSTEAMMIGERMFAVAVDHVNHNRWAEAQAELARAAKLLPRSERLHLYQKWTSFQLRPDRPPTRGERHELGRAATAALQEDVGFAFGYYIAGDLALSDDDVVQAERMLTRAVKLDPSLRDAHRLLRLVGRRTNVRRQQR